MAKITEKTQVKVKILKYSKAIIKNVKGALEAEKEGNNLKVNYHRERLKVIRDKIRKL